MKDPKDIKLAIILHRLLRWGFGALFTSIGFAYYIEGGWAAILFGAIFLVTGFFRPKRCLEEAVKFNQEIITFFLLSLIKVNFELNIFDTFKLNKEDAITKSFIVVIAV